jgi:hypothetical protein
VRVTRYNDDPVADHATQQTHFHMILHKEQSIARGIQRWSRSRVSLRRLTGRKRRFRGQTPGRLHRHLLESTTLSSKRFTNSFISSYNIFAHTSFASNQSFDIFFEQYPPFSSVPKNPHFPADDDNKKNHNTTEEFSELEKQKNSNVD